MPTKYAFELVNYELEVKYLLDRYIYIVVRSYASITFWYYQQVRRYHLLVYYSIRTNNCTIVLSTYQQVIGG